MDNTTLLQGSKISSFIYKFILFSTIRLELIFQKFETVSLKPFLKTFHFPHCLHMMRFENLNVLNRFFPEFSLDSSPVPQCHSHTEQQSWIFSSKHLVFSSCLPLCSSSWLDISCKYIYTYSMPSTSR